MKRYRKKVFAFTLILFFLMLIGVVIFLNATPTYTGYIANIAKGSGTELTKISVVEDLFKYKEPADHTFATYGNGETIFELPWYVPDSELKTGQSVEIYYNGRVRLSDPGQADAYWIKTIE